MRNLIGGLGRIRILDRRILDFPGSVHFHPALNALEALEHDGAVDQQVTDDREGTSRLQMNRLLKLIHQRAAGLPCLAIDDHHAGTAYLLQAVALPDDRSDFFTVHRDRILLNFHQGCNNVETRAIFYIELLRVRLFIRTVLALDYESDCFLFCHLYCPPSYSFLATA